MNSLLPNLLNSVAVVLDIVFTVYMYIIFARVILSWVSPDPYNPIVQFIYKATEPVLEPIRKKLPNMGGIDLSPIILIVAIYFLDSFIVATLKDFAFELRPKWYEKLN